MARSRMGSATVTIVRSEAVHQCPHLVFVLRVEVQVDGSQIPFALRQARLQSGQQYDRLKGGQFDGARAERPPTPILAADLTQSFDDGVIGRLLDLAKDERRREAERIAPVHQGASEQNPDLAVRQSYLHGSTRCHPSSRISRS